MDLQFYGANCIVLTHKGTRIVIDDTLSEFGGKAITKPTDVALYTGAHQAVDTARLTLDSPGEYEVGDVSVIGIPAQAYMDEKGTNNATMFKLIVGDQSVLIAGHIQPDLSESQLEAIGIIDVLFVPVGGNGYTVDPLGAQKLIKDIEPKLVVPTHYADKAFNFEVPQQDLTHALKELAMEPKETISKLKIKPAEYTDVTQLVVLEKA